MTDTTEREFTLTRALDAPRERVFAAWTDPAHLGWFFSGEGSPPPPEVDLRVGGSWRQLMIIDDDTEYMTGGVYLDVAPNEKLVFAWGASDGWPLIEAEHLLDGPVVTVTLADRGAQTDMTVLVALPAHISQKRIEEWIATGIHPGWTQTVDRLVAELGPASEV